MARLREDAEAIWSAAIRAVEPERLVAGQAAAPVSYTHLTLPTIYSV